MRKIFSPGSVSGDGLLIGAACGLVWLFFSGGGQALSPLLWAVAPAAFCGLLALGGCYHTLWAYADGREKTRLLLALSAAAGMTALAGRQVGDGAAGLCLGLLSAMGLLSARLVLLPTRRGGAARSGRHLLIIGAGSAAAMLIRELRTRPDSGYLPLACLDDDRAKWGRRIGGLPVIGGCGDLVEVAESLNIDTILIAIPSAGEERLRTLSSLCAATGCTVLRLPSLYRLMATGSLLPHVERADPAELIGRVAAAPCLPGVTDLIRGQCVMVTGGGGSIGSELCRQAAAEVPRRLVILDWCENGAYTLREELRARHPGLDAVIAIASVQDTRRMAALMALYRPDVVIHAAAHKHLPLMEEAPCEAVKNNVGGTHIVADIAGQCGCGTFVFISTDKAVNPSCVMGRTKRLGELITAAMAARYPGTRYLSVRFGNVIGSAGSVVPLFRRQIAEGGPLRVTHPEATRYFMTIPEAAGLVLSAGAAAVGGELFVLDMGEPVRILTLAENVIRLSGLRPYADIGIRFTGLRPGEKLHEELVGRDEVALPTEHPRIRKARCPAPDPDRLLPIVERLRKLAEEGCEAEATVLLVRLTGSQVIRLYEKAEGQNIKRAT